MALARRVLKQQKLCGFVGRVYRDSRLRSLYVANPELDLDLA